MALLTAAAIEGYKDYTKKTIAYAKYKAGGTYYKTNISQVSVLSDGKLAVDFLIDHTVPGDITVTEVQLYNTNNVLWLSKPESLTRKNVQEGILYRFTFTIQEG
ncbi:MAG: hypothetical protein PHE09_18125 [Oscillospiraceae bacterium]|nr:hypothetical protein [Oscillospiraceae bacterium]